jgi:hypothetical protein
VPDSENPLAELDEEQIAELGRELKPIRPPSQIPSVIRDLGDPPTVLPARIQDLPTMPGMESMTDDQLRSELARLDQRKVQLENQLKGCTTAIETALTILDERHP